MSSPEISPEKPGPQKLPHSVFSHSHRGFRVPDPFAPRSKPAASILHTVLATALFRCWHILVFFSAWSVLITVLNKQGHPLIIQPTLLTVIGTVLGFVISYRTTSSFERYNEGRKLWSQIILASRTFARTVWFHVPDYPSTETVFTEEMKSRSMIEKKTAINLLEAFAVAVKHYLRGEDGIYYKSVLLFVFLAGVCPTCGDPVNAGPPLRAEHPHRPQSSSEGQGSFLYQRTGLGSGPQLPLPATASSPRKTTFREPVERVMSRDQDKVILSQADERFLLPAHMPPSHHIYDLFPFSLLAKVLTRRGREVGGRKAARMRAKMRDHAVSHNVPLEISLYLVRLFYFVLLISVPLDLECCADSWEQSSYISSLPTRKIGDVSTVSALINSLGQLVDGLTGLERILTTPIPFSYSFHLWAVTMIYCLALPFQIYTALGWVTIPGTIIASFIFFGFLAAGEEIENPFGYDKNDLNLDHFTHNIIRNELRAITSTPPPDPAHWAFAPENDLVFGLAPAPGGGENERVTPGEWIKRGIVEIESSLSVI
ncbi:UPF0187-domain-containing protein [Infundibulicybe gibba]|nr:UPF0187-domain-containing protein [Infundibulicybe gibba]